MPYPFEFSVGLEEDDGSPVVGYSPTCGGRRTIRQATDDAADYAKQIAVDRYSPTAHIVIRIKHVDHTLPPVRERRGTGQ